MLGECYLAVCLFILTNTYMIDFELRSSRGGPLQLGVVLVSILLTLPIATNFLIYTSD